MFHESMVELGPVLARPTDLLRLLVVPAFAWAAWTDVQIRRVPNRLWPPLAILGLALLALDAHHYSQLGGESWRLFLLATLLSVGVVVPLVYAFWLLGGFGGADVKALATLAIVFPTFPEYVVDGTSYPVVETTAGAFAFTILTNAVLVGLTYPLTLAATNLVQGNRSRWMFVGRKRDWRALPQIHGRLLETADGFSRDGLDLDALRMYLRWRGIDLPTLRADADRLRDPATLPDEPHPPTDGAVLPEEFLRSDRDTAGDEPSGRGVTGADAPDAPAGETTPSDGDVPHGDGGDADYDDPWGAERFFEDVGDDVYGTDAETLRGGLEVVAHRDAVWYSPGIPFIVPVFVGLIAALLYGDLLFGLLGALGFA